MEQIEEHLVYMHRDGLNTLKYSVKSAEEFPLYTHIRVNVNGPRSIAEMAQFIYASVNPKLMSPLLAPVSNYPVLSGGGFHEYYEGMAERSVGLGPVGESSYQSTLRSVNSVSRSWRMGKESNALHDNIYEPI
jgi:hypothetical protein